MTQLKERLFTPRAVRSNSSLETTPAEMLGMLLALLGAAALLLAPEFGFAAAILALVLGAAGGVLLASAR